MIPPNLTARLAIFVVTSVATTVVPVLVQDRPVLRWTWNRFGPVIETRVKDGINDRLAPAPVPQVKPQIERPRPAPKAYNDGVTLTVPACIDPAPHCRPTGHPSRHPVLNPNDYCRYHWWRAGPVRWVVSLPFRLFR